MKNPLKSRSGTALAAKMRNSAGRMIPKDQKRQKNHVCFICKKPEDRFGGCGCEEMDDPFFEKN